MIEAIRAIALSSGEDLVQALRDLADELEAKTKPKKKAPAKKTPTQKTKPPVDTGEFVMNSSKVEEKSSRVQWRGNKWKPPKLDPSEDVDTPYVEPTPRDRPKNNRVEVTCKKCSRKLKISKSLINEFNRDYVCDKCIAGF